jgi:hypothetical protein
MVIAALLIFATLLVAWIAAPTDARGRHAE